MQHIDSGAWWWAWYPTKWDSSVSSPGEFLQFTPLSFVSIRYLGWLALRRFSMCVIEWNRQRKTVCLKREMHNDRNKALLSILNNYEWTTVVVYVECSFKHLHSVTARFQSSHLDTTKLPKDNPCANIMYYGETFRLLLKWAFWSLAISYVPAVVLRFVNNYFTNLFCPRLCFGVRAIFREGNTDAIMGVQSTEAWTQPAARQNRRGKKIMCKFLWN